MERITRSTVSLFVAIFIAVSLFAVGAPTAGAISVEPQSNTTTTSPNILITSILGSTGLEDLEIYNQSAVPINLAGWSFSFTVKDSGACDSGETTAPVNFPSGWMLSKNYLTFENQGTDPTASIFSVDPDFAADCTASPQLASIQIFNGNDVEQTVNIPDGAALSNGEQQKQRGDSSSTTRIITGVFGTDYPAAKSPLTNLYSDPLYSPPNDSDGLEIVEILPNALSCSPLDTSLACGDYVKLFNSSGSPIDLSAFRLRTNYDGTKSTASNTISLSGTLAAGAYTIVNTKNDGSPLSLTDSGGYVWLEDAYGAQTYQPIIQYPDSGSTTKVGQVWGLNGVTWQWTSDPTAQANDFPPAIQTTIASASASSSLQPCAANQYRNPATNRCDLIASASATLTPCQVGDERNPATNRCRAVLDTSTTLKPCAAGQTRNPATNRCRNSVAASLAKVQDIKTATSSSNNHWRWIIAAAAMLAALAYGLYEWRHELARAGQQLRAKLPGINTDKTKK